MHMSERTSTLLRVTGHWAAREAQPSVHIDEYVPLRYRTAEAALGVVYVRLGNYSTTLVELGVLPSTRVVRGVTVTCLEQLSAWPAFRVAETTEGLPAIAADLEGQDLVDLTEAFNVAVRQGEVLIFWDDIANCATYRCGEATFLSEHGVLAGVWFTNLTDEETALFRSHVPSTAAGSGR